jgi:hypothetical protein
MIHVDEGPQNAGPQIAGHQIELASALHHALSSVLETMFFAEIIPMEDGAGPHPLDALACSLTCSGAETGSFGVVVDRPALTLLCCAFYGEDEADVSPLQMQDLICELTNMLAGSALGAYAPARSCALSSPQLATQSPGASPGGPSMTASPTCGAPNRPPLSVGLGSAGGIPPDQPSSLSSSPPNPITRCRVSLDGGSLSLWCSLRADA